MVKSYKICAIFVLASILALSGCTTNVHNNNQSSVEEHQQQDTEVGYKVPIYPNSEEIKHMPDEELWSSFNISSSLDRKAYVSVSEPGEIYDWYNKNVNDKDIIEKNFLKNPQTNEVDFYYLKLKNDSYGAFIVIMNSRGDMPGDIKSMFAIAQGAWSLVDACEPFMNEQKHNEPGKNSYQDLGLGEGSVVFDITPLADNAYSYIEPLGNLNPGSGHTFPTDHGAFWFKNPFTDTPIYDVRVPAEGVITSVYYRQEQWPDGSGHEDEYYNDYKVMIAHTNTFYSYLDHIWELDASILSQTGELKLGDNPVYIVVHKGDIIGKTGGRKGAQRGLDWGIIDFSKTLQYIHPERYGWYAHSAHFLEYCNQSLKDSLIDKIGVPDRNVKRTAKPLWGKADFDQQGKLVGNWFLQDINLNDPLAEWTKHLSFVYDVWDPQPIRVAVGGSLSIPAILYQVYGNTPDPADVSLKSGKVVYKLQGTEEYGETSIKATLLVETIDNETIKVEGFNGWVSNPTFTENAKYYIR